MSRKSYPRWGGIEKLPKRTSKVCSQCGEPAVREGIILVSYFRGDDDYRYPLCRDNRCRDVLKDLQGLEGEARHA